MAVSGWTPLRLGDLVEIKHGWPFKSEHFHEDLTNKPIVVSVGNFRYAGGFRFAETTVKEYRDSYPREYELAPGDILLIMTCQTAGGEILGIPARVPNDGRTYLHNQRLGKVVIRDNASVAPDFLYWLFLWREFNRELVTSASGTKILHTAPARIEAFRFDLPPEDEQRAIAHILGTLDDKIELNRRMNETLEAMARALFKSWFVDFLPVRANMEARNRKARTQTGDPVRAKAEGRNPGLPRHLADLVPDSFEDSELGEIPRGWEVGSIYTAAEVIYGAPFSSAKFNSDGIGKPLIRIRDLVDESPGVFTAEEHPKGYLVKPGDIVVGMDGEFRSYLWGGVESWLNQRVCVFKPKTGFSSPFVLHSIIGLLAGVEATETATTVIHLGKNDIDRFKIVVPAEPILTAFGQLADPLFQRIVVNKQESRTLTALHDTLLPKLISGELRLKDVQRFMEKAV